MFERYNGGGITAQDILELADWIKEHNVDTNIPVKISQNEEGLTSNALDLKADRESINIYDWI